MKRCKPFFRDMPLENKLRISYILMILPIVLMFVVSIILLYRENRRYDAMVDVAGKASQFSITFKDDFDYECYLIIVESKPYSESKLKDMIGEAKTVVDTLKLNNNGDDDNARRLMDIEKYLNNLSTYVDRIEQNLIIGDKYEENYEIWENDIQIVTALIKESILQFIFFELQDIQIMRNDLNEFFSNMMKIIAIFGIVIIASVIALSDYVSRTITSPIKYLSNVTRRVSEGDLTVRANLNEGAEVGVLSESLDVMIGRINELIEQVKVEQINLRNKELELLQSQINPHFLYNTLDTIVWLAEAGKSDMVVHMVGSLSDFFRTTLNDGKDIVPIRDELRHVNSYLEIQKVRYQDILEYDINVDETVNEYIIPKITLQPLVENALYHGIKNKRGEGKISVVGSIAADGDSFYIKVMDNGIGIKPERLKLINDKINNVVQDENEVYGLYNVNERIRLTFGKEYGITVESEYGVGTAVTVKLPLKTSVS